MRFRLPKHWATGFLKKADRLGAALAVCAALVASPLHAEARNYASGFVGAMSDNEWGDLAVDWGSVTWRNATPVGGVISREWPVGRFGYVGTELSAVKYFGEQTHIEFAVPLFVRTPRPENIFLPSLAYGLGVSYATEPPKTEIARTGESTELLAHWFFDVEFGNDASQLRPFVRLHHRSHAWETFGARTGSNALVIGLRMPLYRN